MRSPMEHVLDGDLPIHKNDNTKLVIALPEGNALRETYAYEYLDVYVHWDGRLTIHPRYRDERMSPREKENGTDWNYPRAPITDLSEIPIETRREIQQTWELYLDTLAKVRDLSILSD